MCRKLLCVAVLAAMFSLVLGGSEAQAKHRKCCPIRTCQPACCQPAPCHTCNSWGPMNSPCGTCFQQPACGCQSFGTYSDSQPVYMVRQRHFVTTSVCCN